MRDVDRQIQYAYIRLAKKSFTPQESKMQQQALSSQISLDLKLRSGTGCIGRSN